MKNEEKEMKEKILKGRKIGLYVLLGYLLGLGLAVIYIISYVGYVNETIPYYGVGFTEKLVFILAILYIGLAWIILCGLKILRPQEAYVFTVFGKYIGTVKGEGFYFIHPFARAFNPAAGTRLGQSGDVKEVKKLGQADKGQEKSSGALEDKRISLKVMTLNNSKQKINDYLGNPVEIGIAVMWKVKDTAKAVFNVDNFKEYLSLQADTALRNIVRQYPYDVNPNYKIDTTGDGEPDDGSLRGSSEVVARRIKEDIQSRVEFAGLEIVDARITHLSYAPEIAQSMLVRQQASALIDARAMIVDGAVGMVEMALDQLEDKGVVDLDEERKAAMVSNLMVVLCGNSEVSPVINSGSLY